MGNKHAVDAERTFGPDVIIDPGTAARALHGGAAHVGTPDPDLSADGLGGRTARDDGGHAGEALAAGVAAFERSRGTQELTAEERAVVDEMRARDQSVRQEETAHAAMAGDMAGAIQYEYAVGPDGQRYVVNGSVPITSPGSSDPKQAARDAARLTAAAHAAINPSAADLAAARKGYAAMGEAQALHDQARHERTGALDLSA